MFGSYPYPRNFYAQNTVEFLTVYVKDGVPARLSDDSKKASILTKKEWLTFTRQVWDIPVPGRGDPAYGEHSALMPEEMARRCVRLSARRAMLSWTLSPAPAPRSRPPENSAGALSAMKSWKTTAP